MPKLRIPNPKCPACGSATRKNGKTRKGYQRYRCMASETCGKTFAPDTPEPPKPKSRAEIQADYRQRHGLTGNEARNREKED